MSRKNIKQHEKRKLKPIFLMAIILLSITLLVNSIGKLNNITVNSLSQENSEIDELKNIRSKNAILVDNNNGEIIAEKNSNTRCYPASLTKIMTTIVAIDELNDLDVKIPIRSSMFESLRKSGASMTGFLPDEKVKAKDVLYGIMLPSGAESSIAVAEYISGSEDNFIKLMNEKAKELGMKNTHFTNVTGLHDNNHYTTVFDLSLLLDYALEDEIFRTIFTTEKYSTSPTNLNSAGITFSSSTFEKMDAENFVRGKVMGGKTGYTEEAGNCLASLLKNNGNEYILITTGAKKTDKEPSSNIVDAFNIYNTYFTN
ncbi:D-alanyl-D-alanine carboxypeptidase family protein [Metaclostridioides mangenotii]|uniref:D-alanyl-D-alanine carboxypeptidase (Penicillin-binding protein 5/6) n=1 Tax=Metaclostridioides mangenotii TaxID=1540 RepID=A0ABS4EBN8_9FIRM|nr:serine hydrolase [Clostridioides mangenotii]MBP1855359.1 D-alanyl-D-alanine carboxypeptidase (penicillin-binding protein 5/6) [Clostridioides mangenotii]